MVPWGEGQSAARSIFTGSTTCITGATWRGNCIYGVIFTTTAAGGITITAG